MKSMVRCPPKEQGSDCMKKSFIKPKLQKFSFASEDVITLTSLIDSSFIDSNSSNSSSHLEFETEVPDCPLE